MTTASPSVRRLRAALVLWASLSATLCAEPAPELTVAGQQRIAVRTLARPSALLGGLAHIGAGASSPAADGSRITHLDPDTPVLELGAPAELDASRVLPLLKAGIPGPLQRVAGHDAVLTLVGDDLYIERRTLTPDEHVLSMRAFWEQPGEITCGLQATQIQYDITRRQWSLAAVADTALLLAISETSDPTGHWEVQRMHLPSGRSFGALSPTVIRTGNGLLVRAGVVAEAAGSACAASGEAVPGEPAEWQLAAKDTRARDSDMLANPGVFLDIPSFNLGGGGSGTSANFTFHIFDPATASNLRQGWLLLNSSLDGRNACWISYDVATNRLSLVNDAGTGVAGSVTPGEAGTAENSQCSIRGVGSNASTLSRDIYVEVAVVFKPQFRGTKLIYLHADDKSGRSSSWQLRGYWQVPPASLPPVSPRMSPTGSSGTSSVFTVTFSDPDGSQDVRQVWLLFNAALGGRDACWVFYDTRARQFGLVNDAGTGEAGRVALNHSATVENSQCTLHGSNSEAFGIGYGGTETYFYARFSLTFKPAFAGLKTAYAYADDLAGQTIGWREMGQWIVPAANPQPRALGVYSVNYQGAAGSFTFSVADPAGHQNVRQASLLVSGTLSGANACWMSHDAVTGRITLVNNAGTGEAGQVMPGVAGTAENDQCVISGAGTSVTRSDYNGSVNVTVPVRFKPAFEGVKALWVQGDNRNGQTSGWQPAGGFAVLTTNLPPLIWGVAALVGNSASTTLAARVKDPNRATDIRQVWVLVNTTLSGAGACWVFYDRPSDQMGLVNDAGNGEVGRVTPGTVGTVENSQCTLSGANSYRSLLDDEINAAFAITSKPAFRGLKALFANAIDQGGLLPGWQALNSWQIP